jgi:hypothetical protein
MVVIFFYICGGNSYHAYYAGITAMVLAGASFCGNLIRQSFEDYVVSLPFFIF